MVKTDNADLSLEVRMVFQRKYGQCLIRVFFQEGLLLLFLGDLVYIEAVLNSFVNVLPVEKFIELKLS